MLSIPESGFKRSVDAHNTRVVLCADWVEGSVFFQNKQITDTEVVEALCENHVYDNQDFARAYLDDVQRELARRTGCFAQEAILKRVSARLEPQKAWDESPAYAFCLLMSLAVLYPEWAKKNLADYSAQGELFELITESALTHLFPGWKACRVGWSPGQPQKIEQVAEVVAKCLADDVGDVAKWASEAAQDGGLDIVLYRPFVDGRCGVPAYLFQCASGAYEDKLHTPRIELWRKIVDFSSEPRKAFATPYAFDLPNLRRSANKINGPIFDRFRLLAFSGKESTWLPQKLADRLKKWMKPKISKLPVAD